MRIINLVPALVRVSTRTQYRMGIVYAAISLLLVIIGNSLAIHITHEDTMAFYAIGLIMSPAIVLMLYHGIRYRKVALAMVFLCDDELCVIDGWGEIWRRIPYSTISCVKREVIAGTFYGKGKETRVAEYICLYLNGFAWTADKQHDSVHYSRLYKMEQFFMIAYDDDAFKFLLSKTTCNNL